MYEENRYRKKKSSPAYWDMVSFRFDPDWDGRFDRSFQAGNRHRAMSDSGADPSTAAAVLRNMAANL